VLVIKFMKLKINMEHSIFFIFNLKARSRMWEQLRTWSR
jgi:hypothetical protein